MPTHPLPRDEINRLLDEIGHAAYARGYADAVAAITKAANAASPSPVIMAEIIPHDDDQPTRPTSRMTPRWVSILSRIKMHGWRSFSAADVVSVSEELADPVSMNLVRSQVYQWVKRKMARKVRKGTYALTAKAIEVIDHEHQAVIR